MITIAITGSRGRMGQRIYDLAKKDGDLSVVALLERANHPELHKEIDGLSVTSNLSILKAADVLIDFTLPEATTQNVEAAVRSKTKMVVGTTGLSPDHLKIIEQASKEISIVCSSNMSVGVNLVFKLVQELSRKVDQNYHARIIETHHIHKKDAPSGTAKTLAHIIEDEQRSPVTDIQSVREGEVVGDHDIIFESDVDIITVRHHAKTRDIFAQGALVAAKFIQHQKTGLFSMQDVLGIK